MKNRIVDSLDFLAEYISEPEKSSIILIGERIKVEQYISRLLNKDYQIAFFDNQASSKGKNVENKFVSYPLGNEFTHEHRAEIKKGNIFLIETCSLNLLIEIFYLAQPFSKIILINSIDEYLKDFDFYSTVHYKNLELIFINYLHEKVL